MKPDAVVEKVCNWCRAAFRTTFCGTWDLCPRCDRELRLRDRNRCTGCRGPTAKSLADKVSRTDGAGKVKG